MEEKKNWGGRREGSGRPKGIESSIISIKLKFNRSEYINNALRTKMKKDGYI